MLLIGAMIVVVVVLCLAVVSVEEDDSAALVPRSKEAAGRVEGNSRHNIGCDDSDQTKTCSSVPSLISSLVLSPPKTCPSLQDIEEVF